MSRSLPAKIFSKICLPPVFHGYFDLHKNTFLFIISFSKHTIDNLIYKSSMFLRKTAK